MSHYNLKPKNYSLTVAQTSFGADAIVLYSFPCRVLHAFKAAFVFQAWAVQFHTRGQWRGKC